METIRYKQGKNPNSLANLKRGFSSPQKQLECSRKGNEYQKTKRTMREVAQDIFAEKQEYIIRDEQGNEVKVTISRLEAMVRTFIDGCIETPTPQKIECLRKLLGEDETTIIVDAPKPQYRNNFDDINLPKEIKVELALAIMKANRYADTHKDEVK